MKKAGTQSQLSERAGIKVNQISKLEQDASDPHLSTLHKLMSAFGCSPDSLLMDPEHLSTDALLKLTLERAVQLPEANKRAIIEVVDKYCIACKVEQEFRDPREVGFSTWLDVQEVLDPELAEKVAPFREPNASSS